MKKFWIAGLLAMTAGASQAADFNLGVVTPQETKNVFDLFSGTLNDRYLFTVQDTFALTGIVTGYDVTDFGVALYAGGNLLFEEDILTNTTPVTSFNNGITAELQEKTLLAGDYALHITADSTDTSSAYIGSLTVGRAAPGAQPSVAAVPEPQTYAMMLAGLAMLGFAQRKRQQV